MDRSLRAGRVATFAFFGLNGFVMGMWVVHIPSVEHRAGIGAAALGWLLLALGAGAFAGMQVAGPLADRYGARTVVPLSAALCSGTAVLPGLATGAGVLAVALLALGVSNGLLDASMNVHAVEVEHRYRRPVMSAFHATYSIGGVLASLVGARTLSWGWSPATTLACVGVLGLATAGLAAPALLPRPGTAGSAEKGSAGSAGATGSASAVGTGTGTGRATSDAADGDSAADRGAVSQGATNAGALGHDAASAGANSGAARPGSASPGTANPAAVTLDAANSLAARAGSGGPATAARIKYRTPQRIWALAALALMVMLSEGVANDWSALHLRTVLHASPATAALAYGTFAAAMTTGRLLTDRVAGKLGAAAVLRYGAATAALGMTCAALSPNAGLAIAGWGVFGLGLSGCVPQLFSAAGHTDRANAGANVSRVAGLGYLGMLAGPAVIGALTRIMPLNAAFFLPIAFCATAAAASPLLTPHPTPTPERTPAPTA
ncbi:MFS transporter [Actinacidiphila guanduensis]|nr:MFS transporter [Actinacidiphila guanduensis]